MILHSEKYYDVPLLNFFLFQSCRVSSQKNLSDEALQDKMNVTVTSCYPADVIDAHLPDSFATCQV